MAKNKKTAEQAAEQTANQAVEQAAEQTANSVFDAMNSAAQKAKKMTDEEAEALVASLTENALYHRCLVVPFNTAEWVPGTIAGITRDKNRNSVCFAIRLDDGRRILKQHDSKLVKVSEEKAAIAQKPRRIAERMTAEEAEEAYNRMAEHVGQLGESDGQHFRIVGLLRDARSSRVYYRVIYTESARPGFKSEHNVQLFDFDEEGMALNAKYKERVDKAPATDTERLQHAEEAVKKAELTLHRAEASLAAKLEALAVLKEKLAAKVGAESTNEPAEESSEDNDLL